MNTALVTVVIPCYNQARYLGEAIESVLVQSYSNIETVVVDDGSSEDCKSVAQKYEAVRCVRQERRGLSGARNRGMEESEGEYVVFLDADDRLMREGVEEGVRSLEAHPECAFVYGRYKTITAEGLPLSTGPRHREDKDQYMALLRRNFIGMHATVMYRRGVLELTGGFDTTLAACEDYDLYLRIARNYPVCSHDSIVAEYRQHDSNMSGDAELMLKTSLNALRLQRGYLKSDRRLEQAYRDGIAYWKNYYGALLARRVQAQAQSRDWALALGGALVLLRHSPRELARLAVAEGKQKAARAPRKLLARLFRYRRSES